MSIALYMSIAEDSLMNRTNKMTRYKAKHYIYAKYKFCTTVTNVPKNPFMWDFG